MALPKRKDFWQRINLAGLNYDWVLLGIVIALCVFGLAFFASSLTSKGPDDYWREFLHQLIFGVWIGGVLAFILSKTDYHLLFKYRNHILFAGLAMLLFIAGFILFADMVGISRRSLLASVEFLPIRPYLANDAVRWITTPISNFQPSELSKLTLLIYFASFLAQHEKEGITWLGLKRPLYAFALTASLIIIQPDLGSIILTFMILFSAMWVAKVPLRILAPIVTVVLIFSIFFAFSGYRRARIEAVFDPNSAAAYQISRVRDAMENGGMWGQGYGNSQFKQNNLIPEVTTDAILGVIGEEVGFVGTTIFLSLYLVLFLRGLKIAQEAPDLGGRAIATGISVWIVAQAFLNITGITGITPLKGLPLPFVSEGGSALIINLASIGILLNISSQRVVQEVKKVPGFGVKSMGRNSSRKFKYG